jgi:hypothetical protein
LAPSEPFEKPFLGAVQVGINGLGTFAIEVPLNGFTTPFLLHEFPSSLILQEEGLYTRN